MASNTPREQDHSIKARKSELYDKEVLVNAGPRRRFAAILGDTTAAPLAHNLKVGLAVVGGLVLLIFLAAIMTIPGPRVHRRPAQDSAASAPAK